MPRVMCIHLPVAGGCVWGEQEVIRVSDIKAKPREERAEHCYTAMHHQESWTSCLIYRQLQGCSVLWNRCRMGKHVSSIFPVSILDFRESRGVRGPAAWAIPGRLAGPCSRQWGRQAERERVQPSLARPKDSNTCGQMFHLASPTDRAWLCAWCLCD